MGLSVVTLASVLVLSLILKRDNKMVHELALLGLNIEGDDGQHKQQAISHHNEDPSAGRTAGSTMHGRMASYQT